MIGTQIQDFFRFVWSCEISY